MSDQTSDQQQESVIVIRFAAPNSTIMDIKYQNISPLQAIAAAWIIQQEAEMTMKVEREARRQQDSLAKIAVPGRGM